MNNLRDQYVARGYDFYERPPKHVIPGFLGGFHPDAIAVRGGEGVVLEIKPRGTPSTALQHVAERFEGQPKWKFRVIYFDDLPEGETAEPEHSVRLEDHQPRIQALLRSGATDLALMLAWSVLEGVVRTKIKPAQRGPLTSLQIVERLEHAGTIDSGDAKQLRQAAVVRNGIAHGHFDINPGTGLVEAVLDAATKVQALRRFV